MIYLFVGQDYSAKEKKIAEIKAKIFPSPQALSFDYQVLHAHHLDSESLAEALSALPAASLNRLVMIHQADELTALQKDLIVNLHEKAKESLCVILEADYLDEDDSLFKKHGAHIKAEFFDAKTRHDVFDLMGAVLLNHKKEALVFLDELLKEGDHPLQVIGGMFWKWKHEKRRIPLVKFVKGLVAFKQADLNIKRSRLRPEHALEILVVKLCA